MHLLLRFPRVCSCVGGFWFTVCCLLSGLKIIVSDGDWIKARPPQLLTSPYHSVLLIDNREAPRCRRFFHPALGGFVDKKQNMPECNANRVGESIIIYTMHVTETLSSFHKTKQTNSTSSEQIPVTSPHRLLSVALTLLWLRGTWLRPGDILASKIGLNSSGSKQACNHGFLLMSFPLDSDHICPTFEWKVSGHLRRVRLLNH